MLEEDSSPAATRRCWEFGRQDFKICFHFFLHSKSQMLQGLHLEWLSCFLSDAISLYMFSFWYILHLCWPIISSYCSRGSTFVPDGRRLWISWAPLPFVPRSNGVCHIDSLHPVACGAALSSHGVLMQTSSFQVARWASIDERDGNA